MPSIPELIVQMYRNIDKAGETNNVYGAMVVLPLQGKPVSQNIFPFFTLKPLYVISVST